MAKHTWNVTVLISTGCTEHELTDPSASLPSGQLRSAFELSLESPTDWSGREAEGTNPEKSGRGRNSAWRMRRFSRSWDGRCAHSNCYTWTPGQNQLSREERQRGRKENMKKSENMRQRKKQEKRGRGKSEEREESQKEHVWNEEIRKLGTWKFSIRELVQWKTWQRKTMFFAKIKTEKKYTLSWIQIQF